MSPNWTPKKPEQQDDGVNVAQVWLGLAIGLFVILVWAAIQLAPLMR